MTYSDIDRNDLFEQVVKFKAENYTSLSGYAQEVVDNFLSGKTDSKTTNSIKDILPCYGPVRRDGVALFS